MQTLHIKITESVKEYRKQEAILIDLVQEADFTKFYLEFGYSSLFDYLNLGQGITAATVSNLISVARKSIEIPEMKEAIAKGEVGLAKLRKVAAVITPQNKSEWIEKSKTLSCRALEKEVSKVSPYKPRRDHWQRINSEYLRLSLDVSEEFKSLAERATDVFSKKFQINTSLAEAMTWAMKEALAKHDPLVKAEKIQRKSKDQSVTQKPTDSKAIEPSVTEPKNGKRTPIHKPTLREIYQRDQGQCTYTKDGKRCIHKRFLHIHHLKAVKDGGDNTLDNLTTLCTNHHAFLHHREELEKSLVLFKRGYLVCVSALLGC